MDADGGGELGSGAMRLAAGKNPSAALTSRIHLLSSPLRPLPRSFASICRCCSAPGPRHDAHELCHVTLAPSPAPRLSSPPQDSRGATRRGVDLLLRPPLELQLVFVDSMESIGTRRSPHRRPAHPQAPHRRGRSGCRWPVGLTKPSRPPRSSGGLFITPG
jgi:hypothetical protein